MALMNVLIVSSVALVILTSLVTTLFGETQIITDSIKTQGAYYMAQSCAEE